MCQTNTDFALFAFNLFTLNQRIEIRKCPYVLQSHVMLDSNVERKKNISRSWCQRKILYARILIYYWYKEYLLNLIKIKQSESLIIILTVIYANSPKTFSCIFSRILFFALGHSSMYYGEKGTIRIQREPIHIHDDLQWISFIDFLKRIHVSHVNTFDSKLFLQYYNNWNKWIHIQK